MKNYYYSIVRILKRVSWSIKYSSVRVFYKIFKARITKINAVLHYCLQYRKINITGGYGMGKTLITVALSYSMYEMGRVERIYSNIPIKGQCFDFSFGDNWVMVLDETHVIADARDFRTNKTKDWLRDLRKRNSVMFFPAVEDVDKKFRDLEIDAEKKFGNIAWRYKIYRRQKDDSLDELLTFFLIFPFYYFGLYSTEYSPTHNGFDIMMSVASNPFEVDIRNEKALKDFPEFAKSPLAEY